MTNFSAANAGQFGQPGASAHPELGQYVSNDASFPTAYLKAVAAIASSDGVLNVADFNALSEVAALLNDSALARVVLLESIERPTAWRTAIAQLQAASAGIDQASAAAAFEAARTLLLLQGVRSRDMARVFGEALGYAFRPNELEAFPTDEETLWRKISTGSVRMIKGRKYADLADLCLRATGDLALAQAVLDVEQGAIEHGALSQRITAACVRANDEIAAFNQRIADMENTREATAAFLDTAHALQQQVRQRVAIADARIAFEREGFSEDIEEYIHDAGNAFERDVVERLGTDQWKKAAVWESIAQSTFGKELERRVNRIISRREESLRLINEDLRLFQQEISLSRATILQRQHHTQLATAAPALRWGTRMKNGVESAAATTLNVGGVAILGTGAAAYFLGAAVVLPAIAPAVPIVGGVMVVAGVFKWLMNPADRKTAEIGHQRAAFEKAFRLQLEAARAEMSAQLDDTAARFHEAAERLVQPVLLEAQAADRLATLHVAVARRLNDHSQRALADMLKAIPE